MIKESLRKWPPTDATTRVIDVDDFKIENYLIPKNTIVNVLNKIVYFIK